jgi:hypothetical protein
MDSNGWRSVQFGVPAKILLEVKWSQTNEIGVAVCDVDQKSVKWVDGNTKEILSYRPKLWRTARYGTG